MGMKRSFDAEEMQEFNAKNAKQLSYSHKQLNQLNEAILENPTLTTYDASHVETCAPLSCIQTSLCQEDTLSALSDQSSGSDFTGRQLSPVEDVYSCLMNHPPRKQVLVGSNHQADIPECNRANDESEGKLMGKCVIQMPESDVFGVGEGRKECFCPDKSSVRCVRRHIMEARENLMESIGYERFMELGLCEMGEEVESLWKEDEEDLFHKVVYSNPVSLGCDFWKQLKSMFPSRTMKELVCYYFNVFILRRRSTQNRFIALEVDSDDDEWQVEYDIFHSAESLDEEDNDNGISSSHEDNEEEEDVHCVYMDKVSSIGEEVNVEDDSCMSFELHETNLILSHNSQIENRDCNISGDDACDRRLVSSDCMIKTNVLLPTSNIIKDIFAQDDDDNSKKK